MSDNNDPMPPGWESRYDLKTKRHYYVDNYTRSSTWEDPRPRYRALLQQSRQASPSHSSNATSDIIPIPLQHAALELRGSSTVYPTMSSYPPPPQPAFQLPPTPFSHLAPGSSYYQDMGSGRPSPVMGRTVLQRVQTTTTMDSSTNTDELVAKINATFPTASETHIRLLLKKYHNREAVVMSALQVEKHPLATPGPYSTPPLSRNVHLPGSYSPIQMTPPLSMRGTPLMTLRGSPPTRPTSSAASSYFGSPRFGEYSQSQRPQHSPKMKLRYLKNVFPKAEETLLLDVLASEDNNVNRATEKLKAMGYDKNGGQRNAPVPPITKEEEVISRTPLPRVKSHEEKNSMKGRLQGLYEDVPERLIMIAMESADFEEEKARQILHLMAEEKENQPVTTSGLIKESTEGENCSTVTKSSTSKKESENAIKKSVSLKFPKSDVSKVSRGTSTAEDWNFRSPLVQRPEGRNSSLRKGPNDKLLLVEYVTWSGPNSDLRAHPPTATLAKGPSKALLSEKRFIAKGPNKDLRKGATLGLAKGSIYSCLTEKLQSRGQ